MNDGFYSVLGYQKIQKQKMENEEETFQKLKWQYHGLKDNLGLRGPKEHALVNPPEMCTDEIRYRT